MSDNESKEAENVNAQQEEKDEVSEDEDENFGSECEEDEGIRKPVVFTEEELQANLDRVQFTPAVPKDIISKHSGSILVQDEPHITLSGAMTENVTRIFEEHVESDEPDPEKGAIETSPRGQDEDVEEGKEVEKPIPKVHQSKLVDMLGACGFSDRHVPDICKRMYNGSEEMELEDFLQFYTRFYAPSYYYGQRLRRFVGRNEVSEVFDLLARGCDVNTGDGEGMCPLHYASMYNHAKMIEELVAYAPDSILIDAVDRYGWTPLHCACQHGNMACVQALLQAGADARIADKNGKTSLHVASCQARNQIIEVLVEHDPSMVNIVDNRGMTPVHDAAFKGHSKTFRILCGVEGVDESCKDILKNIPAKYLDISEDSTGEESKY